MINSLKKYITDPKLVNRISHIFHILITYLVTYNLLHCHESLSQQERVWIYFIYYLYMCVPDAGSRWMCGKPLGKPEQICWKQETGAQRSWSESNQGNMGNSQVTPMQQVQTQRFLRPKKINIIIYN